MIKRRISESSGEARETSFLYQRISILMQRFNAVLLHDRLHRLMIVPSFVFIYILFNF